jgi:hypothetical protein
LDDLSFVCGDKWASSGLTDIHHQGHSPGKDVHYGDHGTEEAPSSSLVDPGLTSSSDAEPAIARSAGERPGLTTEERAELTRLRRENRLDSSTPTPRQHDQDRFIPGLPGVHLNHIQQIGRAHRQ